MELTFCTEMATNGVQIFPSLCTMYLLGAWINSQGVGEGDYQTHFASLYVKGSSLKGKNLLPMGANSFLLE